MNTRERLVVILLMRRWPSWRAELEALAAADGTYELVEGFGFLEFLCGCTPEEFWNGPWIALAAGERLI